MCGGWEAAEYSESRDYSECEMQNAFGGTRYVRGLPCTVEACNDVRFE